MNDVIKKYNLTESIRRFKNLVDYDNAKENMGLREALEDDPQMGQGASPGMSGNVGSQSADTEMDPQNNDGGFGTDMGDSNSDGDVENQPEGADDNESKPVEKPEGLNPQSQTDEMDGGMMSDDVRPEEEGDEVIDVDDLTKAQESTAHKVETTDKKIDGLTGKFERVLDALDAFEKKITDYDNKIDSLRAEFEKRNPTPQEKLTIRSLETSAPFNQTVGDYWEKKKATSNYSSDSDNDGKDDPRYKITKRDIDNISDWANISKTMDEPVNLNDMLDF